MTALRFQTGGGHQTSLASLQGEDIVETIVVLTLNIAKLYFQTGGRHQTSPASLQGEDIVETIVVLTLNIAKLYFCNTLVDVDASPY